MAANAVGAAAGSPAPDAQQLWVSFSGLVAEYGNADGEVLAEEGVAEGGDRVQPAVKPESEAESAGEQEMVCRELLAPVTAGVLMTPPVWTGNALKGAAGMSEDGLGARSEATLELGPTESLAVRETASAIALEALVEEDTAGRGVEAVQVGASGASEAEKRAPREVIEVRTASLEQLPVVPVAAEEIGGRVQARAGGDPVRQSPAAALPPAKLSMDAPAELCAAELAVRPEAAAEQEERGAALGARVRLAGQERQEQPPVAFAVQMPAGRGAVAGENQQTVRRRARAAVQILASADRFCTQQERNAGADWGEGFAAEPPERPVGETEAEKVAAQPALGAEPEVEAAGSLAEGAADSWAERGRRPPQGRPVQAGMQEEPVRAVNAEFSETRGLAKSEMLTDAAAAGGLRPVIPAVVTVAASPKPAGPVRAEVEPAGMEEVGEARGAVRELRLKVDAGEGRPVNLVFREQAGSVRVVARAADPGVSETLRADLDSLRERGFESVPQEGALVKTAARGVLQEGAGSNSSGEEQGGGRPGMETGEQDRRKNPQNLVRWLAVLDRQREEQGWRQEGDRR